MKTTKWKMDPAHTELTFKARHMMVSNVSGVFKDFNIIVETKGEELEDAKISVEVDLNSIDTRIDKRNDHLKSADFLDVAHYPTMTFESVSFRKVEDDIYELKGNLTLHGVTQPVGFEVEYGGMTKGFTDNLLAGFSINGSISRKDFGLVYNPLLETGGAVVSDKIKFAAEVKMEEVAEPALA